MRNILTIVALAALACPACGSLLAPQVARTIPIDRMQQQGAMLDASRAYRLAFYANPGQSPEVVEVSAGIGGTRVALSQWTTELARTLNIVVGRVQRFDERFQELSVEIFNHDIEQGDVIYRWRPPVEGPKFGKARVATLKMIELKTTSGADGITGHGTIEVVLGTWVHLYACEAVGQQDWMQRTMACLGEKILGDPSFWKAAEAVL